MSQSTQTTTSKPTIIEGIIGLIVTLVITRDYSIFNDIPLYVIAPIMMFSWNYPILLVITNKKFYMLMGWQDQHNT
jgi:hypothetical protein